MLTCQWVEAQRNPIGAEHKEALTLFVSRLPADVVEQAFAKVMAEHGGQRVGQGAVEHRQIGVADAGGADLHHAPAQTVGIDARDGKVAVEGWAETSETEAVDLARRFEDAGVAALLFTDVGRDGMLKGCNVQATVDLARACGIPVIASGGVGSLADLDALRKQHIQAVILGRALYEGSFTLQEALARC